MNSSHPEVMPASVTPVTAGSAFGSDTIPPFNFTSKQSVRLLGSIKLFRRLRHAGWLRPLEPSAPGRPSLFPYSRLLEVQSRMERGEFPPLLDCEVLEKRRNNTISERQKETIVAHQLRSA
jgi:hypothetical protein